MATIKTIDGKEFQPEIPNRLLKIAQDIIHAGGRAFLVGGWVRDALLGGTCRDYDIEVYDINQEVLLPILSKYGRTNLVGKAFGVIHLATKGLSLDFSFPRTESKVGYGHKGFVVRTNEKLSFKEAALRRDFTINAMGMELPSLILCDPFHGMEDLKAHCLRHVGPAFVEDSLRILRGVQFASRFELTLAPETIQLCRTLSLSDLSTERIFEEFKKWLLKPGKPSLGLQAFLDIKLNEYFPEVKPLETENKKGWQFLGEFLDNLSQSTTKYSSNSSEDNLLNLKEEERMILMFAGLLSGNGTAAYDENAVMTFLNRITNEVKLLRGVPLLLRYAFQISLDGFPDDRVIRRLSNAMGGLRLWTVFVENCPLYNALYRQQFIKKFRMQAIALHVFNEAPQPYLTGKMLMNLGVKPGKEMGELIKEAFELQLDGKILEVSAALEWAKEKLLLQ